MKKFLFKIFWNQIDEMWKFTTNHTVMFYYCRNANTSTLEETVYEGLADEETYLIFRLTVPVRIISSETI